MSGVSSEDFLQELGKRNVLAVPVDAERVRMVTHLDVDGSEIDKAAAIVREVLKP